MLLGWFTQASALQAEASSLPELRTSVHACFPGSFVITNPHLFFSLHVGFVLRQENMQTFKGRTRHTLLPHRCQRWTGRLMSAAKDSSPKTRASSLHLPSASLGAAQATWHSINPPSSSGSACPNTLSDGKGLELSRGF